MIHTEKKATQMIAIFGPYRMTHYLRIPTVIFSRFEDYSRFESDPCREDIVKEFRLGKVGPIITSAVAFHCSLPSIRPDLPTPWPLPIPENGETWIKKMGKTDGKCSSVYIGQFLDVTIIDDAHPLFRNQFLVADKYKAAGILYVDHLDHAENPNKFEFGAVLRIRNPSVLIVPRGDFIKRFYYTTALKLDANYHSVDVVGKKEDMCRYCFKENAQKKCGLCKRQYCGKECQTADWISQDHKAICKPTSTCTS